MSLGNEEQQQPYMKVPVAEVPEGLKESVNQFSNDYKVYVSKEIQMKGDPTSFEEVMRSVHSSRWQEAMEAEINSMNTNDVWDLEEIPNGAKIVGCERVYKTKCDSIGNVERYCRVHKPRVPRGPASTPGLIPRKQHVIHGPVQESKT